MLQVQSSPASHRSTGVFEPHQGAPTPLGRSQWPRPQSSYPVIMGTVHSTISFSPRIPNSPSTSITCSLPSPPQKRYQALVPLEPLYPNIPIETVSSHSNNKHMGRQMKPELWAWRAGHVASCQYGGCHRQVRERSWHRERVIDLTLVLSGNTTKVSQTVQDTKNMASPFTLMTPIPGPWGHQFTLSSSHAHNSLNHTSLTQLHSQGHNLKGNMALP